MKTGKDAGELLKALSRAHREREGVPLGPDFTARVMEAVGREAARGAACAGDAAGLWEGLAQWFTARFMLSLGGAAAAAAALAGIMIRGLEADILRLSLQGASAARYLTLGLQ